jgi:hypothetical protein
MRFILVTPFDLTEMSYGIEGLFNFLPECAHMLTYQLSTALFRNCCPPR